MAARSFATLALFCTGLSLTGCEVAPSHVYSADIDDALARKHYKTMCVGLDMKDDDVRRYATERFETLAEFEPPDPEGIEAGRECVCDHIKNEDGLVDMAVAEGLKSSSREDMVGCLANAVAEPGLPNKKDAVGALSRTTAKAARDTLDRIAKGSDDAEVRIIAIDAIAGDPAYKATLLELATTADAPELRAAATKGLHPFKDDGSVIDALVKLAESDSDGTVRGTALQALKTAGAAQADAMICQAMMQDESPDVRQRAVLAFRGTKRPEAIQCLRERALTEEESGSVRSALLTTLGSSPSDDAAKVLCDAIPQWVKWYSVDDMPDQVPGADIIKAQNDRDWQNSYACVQKAYARKGGFSCYGQRYVGWWFQELGGSGFVPKCPPKYPD
ncbi:MAG: HEAT repeat domain-containing protein [Alphaproteobacteria bacterium]|nr:HEAT repeat domain-containing protein [Alphaproteobacteria bacterium]